MEGTPDSKVGEPQPKTPHMLALRLGEVADRVPALISYVDADLRYRYVNRTYLDWFELEPHDIIGKQLKDVVGDAVYSGVLPELSRDLAGEEFTFEKFMPYKTGGPRNVLVTYIPDRSPDGVVGFFAFVVDLSEKKPVDSALLENYARDHSGTFGISLAELSGKKRRASYNGDKQFITASTYKLFVAYSVLKRVESGKMDWGTNETCFNKMISLSDNPCSEKFLHGIGLGEVTKDMQNLGLGNSTFMKSGGPFTTANDLALFLGFLESGTSLSGQSRDRLLSAIRGNVFRQGIPAGTSGAVADKVGFLNGLLHDAAIVYSPSGTYVLAIMTDGSSWGAIADITRQIETLRVQ